MMLWFGAGSAGLHALQSVKNAGAINEHETVLKSSLHLEILIFWLKVKINIKSTHGGIYQEQQVGIREHGTVLFSRKPPEKREKNQF